MRLSAPGPSVSALLLALMFAVASCTGQIPKNLLNALGESPSPSPDASASTSTGSSPVPTSKPVTGGITSEQGPSPTPRLTGSPTPAATATPQSSQQGQGPFTLSVGVTPSTASIRFAPRNNTSPPLGPTEVQLKALVTFTNGLQSSQVTWRSSDPAIAPVDTLGVVRSGTVEGTAVITAEAQYKTLDGTPATASCTVEVSAKGDVEVVLQ